jgi:glycosyltransferase involved in cell wall biosynthesis
MNDATSHLISIGMPVRNEAKFLRAALDAMTRQAGVNLELIISDNASTDATQEICREYCSKYPWIKYHRFEQNAGATANFHYVLLHATGRYFMWASGHDVWDGDYLQRCAATLDQYPAAVIAYGSVRWIDAAGAPHPKQTGWTDTRGLSVVARYFTAFWGNMNPIIGLMRADDLRMQRLEDLVGGDLVILLGMAMRGDFVHVDGTTWCRREFRTERSHGDKVKRYHSQGFLVSLSWFKRLFPLARLPVRIVSDLFISGLPLSRKLMILLILLVSFPVKYLVDKARREV